MSTFGLRLRELRAAAGLTQEALAKKAGLNRITVANLETDESIPSWPTVLALAKALGVGCEAFPDVAQRLRGSEKRTPPKKRAAKKATRRS
jgi:transcriptional regulator with XRE-family HTH domain